MNETGANDVDTVRSSITYILSNGIERLVLLGSASISGTGNAADNVIIGNSGNNLLNGGVGRRHA